ncbi:helix-turn-helix domain-containing protein [Dysosmobacter sp.]|mgnify:FL=1|uniref:helix-turn-helix domain-containing protein n=1 Tax=Dysosmobacter sp. TaxID=2591382 RepID=UPI003FD74013
MYNKPAAVDSSILASRLRSCREFRGVNKAEMARTLDIAPSSMTYYESGLAIPSVDKLYAIADYLGTSVDYLLGRIEKSPESVRTEKDVADLIISLIDYEGIDLNRDSCGAPVLSFNSKLLNAFFQNRLEIEEIKREAAEEHVPEKYFNKMFKPMRQNETYILRDLEETPLKLKDGIDNVAIRRKRRLTNDVADGPYEYAAETIEADGPKKDIKKDGRHE